MGSFRVGAVLLRSMAVLGWTSLTAPAWADVPAWGEKRLQALYESLSPRSMGEQAAFAELFGEHPLGQKASHRVWHLLAGADAGDPPPVWPEWQVQRLVNRFVFPSSETPPVLAAEHQFLLGKLSEPLGNRKLKGAQARTEQEVLALRAEEIDLARGLLLAQGLSMEQIEAYERCLDLMALQVRARLPEQPSELDKLQALSTFIFVDQRFRFPPKSRMNIQIDQWTMLSEVLDSRRGVCLGVSQLYLCLAQRLDLPLEIITPPGHIYVRWAADGQHWNIETTAHGIHLPTHHYLGLTTKSLRPRDLKEVIGMSLYNAAAVPLHQGECEKAVALYRQAERYLGDEYDLQHAMGMALFGANRVEEAFAVLRPLRGQTKPEQVIPSHLIDEILDGDVEPDLLRDSLKIHRPVREELLAQQHRLEKALTRCPRFFHGYQELAHVFLQLNRLQEAMEVLERAYTKGAREPYILYLLTELALARFDLPGASQYFQDLERVMVAADHQPPLLRELRLRLLATGAPYPS
jgi:tetratricopeptide (TPR) repeat protein